jgi:hypothetical protein
MVRTSKVYVEHSSYHNTPKQEEKEQKKAKCLQTGRLSRVSTFFFDLLSSFSSSKLGVSSAVQFSRRGILKDIASTLKMPTHGRGGSRFSFMNLYLASTSPVLYRNSSISSTPATVGTLQVLIGCVKVVKPAFPLCRPIPDWPWPPNGIPVVAICAMTSNNLLASRQGGANGLPETISTYH